MTALPLPPRMKYIHQARQFNSDKKAWGEWEGKCFFLDRETAISGFNKMNFASAVYDMRLIELDVVTNEMRTILPDSATRQ